MVFNTRPARKVFCVYILLAKLVAPDTCNRIHFIEMTNLIGPIVHEKGPERLRPDSLNNVCLMIMLYCGANCGTRSLRTAGAATHPR